MKGRYAMPRAWLAALLPLLGCLGYAAIGTATAADDRQGGASAAVHADTDAPPAPAVFDDGPYLTYGASSLNAEWVCQGKPVRRAYRVRRWPVTVPPACGYGQPIQVHAPAGPDTRLPATGVARVVALSDVHGQYELMVKLLQANGVISRSLDWRYGDGHLLVSGDVFDRGAQVTEVFWLLYNLEHQARAAGGAVHFLLGNHETMVLYDDLRYVNTKYLRSAELLDKTYPALYGADSVLGQWLRTRPVLGQINDMLFLHGGIGPGHFDLGLSHAEVNARYRGSLGQPKAVVKQDPVLARLYDGKTSPIWYRGYFKDGALSQAETDAIAERLGVKHIIVGHTSMDEIGSYFNGTVIAIDSSIKDGKSGELLFIENGRMSRGTMTGARLPLQPAPAR